MDFSRSHYEEALVVRVHQELPAAERMPDAAEPGIGRTGGQAGATPPN
jgi:hypothetical protein